eukprot:TRINITY_DN30509_c0_g1_i2.p4 TRINITY_DN30509_c0_g1~~TRINITY_DN30509_c0_g1_i2.p4  ORF type:complete len:128 (+),score=2.43 TRINITY_DN30509_c0_g1_i2:1143-1526(+)
MIDESFCIGWVDQSDGRVGQIITSRDALDCYVMMRYIIYSIYEQLYFGFVFLFFQQDGRKFGCVDLESSVIMLLRQSTLFGNYFYCLQQARVKLKIIFQQGNFFLLSNDVTVCENCECDCEIFESWL